MDSSQTQILGETDEQRDIRVNKDIAAFSYIWIMSIAVFFMRRESKFARFHSKQGIVLLLFSIPIGMIPVIGNFLLLLIVAGMVLGFMNAAQGKYADVPLAGALSRGEMTFHEFVEIVTKAMQSVIAAFKRIFSSEQKTNEPSKADPKPIESLPPSSPPKS